MAMVRRLLRTLLAESVTIQPADHSRMGRSIEAPGEPTAYEVLYQEARHALDAQEASLDELRSRAGILLTAASVVGALLGSVVLAEPGKPDLVGWLGLALFVASALTAVLVLLPSFGWEFQADTKDLLRNYIEATAPATLAELHRSLAWYLSESRVKNESKLKHRYLTFVVSAGTLVAGTGLLLTSVWRATN